MTGSARLRVGAFVVPDATDPALALRQIVAADRAELDVVGVQDHPYQPRFHDTWTLLAFAAARTERVQLLTDVASLPLRPPAMLAKAAASLTLLAEGRVTVGLGAGAFWPAVAAMGGPQRTPGASVDALEEAIAILRGWWSGAPSLRLPGEHYSVVGAHPGPAVSTPPGLWIGGYKPRMLRLTGRLADGWLPTVPYLDLAGEARASQAAIDEAARRAGRDPSAVERALNTPLAGAPAGWGDALARLADEHGFGTVLVSIPPDAGGTAMIDRVAEAGRVANDRLGGIARP